MAAVSENIPKAKRARKFSTLEAKEAACRNFLRASTSGKRVASASTEITYRPTQKGQSGTHDYLHLPQWLAAFIGASATTYALAGGETKTKKLFTGVVSIAMYLRAMLWLSTQCSHILPEEWKEAHERYRERKSSPFLASFASAASRPVLSVPLKYPRVRSGVRSEKDAP